MTRTLIVIALCLLPAACGNVSGKPLPVVKRDDPTFALIPDKLEFGALPPQ